MIRFRFTFAFIIGFVLFYNLQAQNETKKIPLSIAVSNNSTQLPGSGYLGFINTPVHPGLTVGTFRSYNEKNTMFQTLKLSYLYHQYSHNAIKINTEFRYDYDFCSKFGISTNIGIGVLYSLTDVQAFTLNKETNVYEPKNNYGRFQFTGGAEFDLNYKIVREEKNPITIFLGYKFWIQTPFVNEYVPILPYTSISLGTVFYISKSNNK